MTNTSAPDATLPALYMVWDPASAGAPDDLPPEYDVAAVPPERVHETRALVELDGPVSDAQWSVYVDQILPGGFFVARVGEAREAIGAASAAHNPRGGRFYFPAGGQVGYLVVEPRHRGHGVGGALVAAAVNRLRTAGYRNIWVAVQDWRLPAIATYLNVGFVPFLYPPHPDGLAVRWEAVFNRLGRASEPASWRREL